MIKGGPYGHVEVYSPDDERWDLVFIGPSCRHGPGMEDSNHPVMKGERTIEHFMRSILPRSTTEFSRV